MFLRGRTLTYPCLDTARCAGRSEELRVRTRRVEQDAEQRTLNTFLPDGVYIVTPVNIVALA